MLHTFLRVQIKDSIGLVSWLAGHFWSSQVSQRHTVGLLWSYYLVAEDLLLRTAQNMLWNNWVTLSRDKSLNFMPEGQFLSLSPQFPPTSSLLPERKMNDFAGGKGEISSWIKTHEQNTHVTARRMCFACKYHTCKVKMSHFTAALALGTEWLLLGDSCSCLLPLIHQLHSCHPQLRWFLRPFFLLRFHSVQSEY